MTQKSHKILITGGQTTGHRDREQLIPLLVSGLLYIFQREALQRNK